jgi:hypothetical protein
MKTKLLILTILLCSFSAFSQKDTIINHEQDTMILVNQNSYLGMTFLNFESGKFSEQTLSQFNSINILETKIGLYSKYLEFYSFLDYGGAGRIYEEDNLEIQEEITLTMTGFELKLKPLHFPVKPNLIEPYISGRSSYFWLLRKENYNLNFSNNQGLSFGGSVGLQYSIYSQSGKVIFYCEYLYDYLNINSNKTLNSIYNDSQKESIKFGMIFLINKGVILSNKNQNKLYKNYEKTYPFGYID